MTLSRRSFSQGLLAGAALAHVPFVRAEPAPPVIRFGVSTAGVGQPPRIVGGSTAVAQSLRLVEQAVQAQGSRVEWIFFKGQGPAVNEAMSNDQLDFTTLGDLPSIIGRSVGIRAKLVMVSSRLGNSYVLVPPSAPFKGVADLKGRRIGLHKGTATQLAADRVLEAHGLGEHDVKIVNLEPAAAAAAFQAGDLDAIFASLLQLKLRDNGAGRVLYSTRRQPDATAQSHVLVSDRFAAQHPALTQQVVTALVRGAAHASEPARRGEVLDLWASAGTPRALFEEEYPGALAPRLSPRFDPFAVALDKRSVDDAFRFKLIRRRFDVDEWIDARYVEAAVKQLRAESTWPLQQIQQPTRESAGTGPALSTPNPTDRRSRLS
jgi:sulfonate transport system substrate-binding protein